jgi:hypothetical protein
MQRLLGAVAGALQLVAQESCKQRHGAPLSGSAGISRQRCGSLAVDGPGVLQAAARGPLKRRRRGS